MSATSALEEFSRTDSLIHEVAAWLNHHEVRALLAALPGLDSLSPGDALDALAPLWTRRLRLNGPGLVAGRRPDAVKVRLEQVESRFASLTVWDPQSLRSALETHLDGPALESQASLESDLRHCLLFAEPRLPLVPAVAFLGREECLRRLRGAIRYLFEVQLIG